MSSRRTSSVPKEDVVFPRMLYCDLRCSQTLTGLSLALPGALLCNATRRLGDRQHVILRQRVRGSVRAVRAVRNTRVFQTETRVVADDSQILISQMQYEENSTTYDVCIAQLQLSRIALLCSYQAGSEGGYRIGLQAEYQAGFRLGSDKPFKCQQALQ